MDNSGTRKMSDGLEAIYDRNFAEYENMRKRAESIMKPQIEAVTKVVKTMEIAGVFRAIKDVNERMGPVLSMIEKVHDRRDNIFPEKETLCDAFPIRQRHGLTVEEIEAIAQTTCLMMRKETGLLENASIKIPKGSTWEDIKIQFSDQFSVEIYCTEEFIDTIDYIKFGFSRKNTKDKSPDKQWKFLQILAVSYAFKTASKINIEFIAQSMGISNEACMKIKEKITHRLQTVFGIKGDPFHDYRVKGEYATRFKLEPVSLMRGNGEIYSHNSAYNDDIDYSKYE